MYFKDREAAGRLLATQISRKYKHQRCAIVALNEGGVVVGMQIAKRLNSVVTMLLTEDITMPSENEALAGITQDGAFSYNKSLSQGQIDEMVMEYHNFIEQEKMKRLHEMHEISGNGQLIRRDLVDDKNIILVKDGLKDGFSLDLALEFLKPIHTKKIIIATPVASLTAVDRMHILGDEIYCLTVVEEYYGTDHYYDSNKMPPRESVIETVVRLVSNWK